MKRILSLCAVAALCLSLLSGCTKPGTNGPTPDKKVDLADFAQTLQENHEFAGFLQRVDPADEEMGELMTQMLDNYYPGLAGLELEQMEVYMSMISFSSGELSLVQAKDADGAAEVKDIFQARIDAKTTEGPGNYPDEVEMWQHSSAIAANGNYVMLVCHEDCGAIVDEFNALF